MKFGSLNLLEPSGPVQAFTGVIYPTIWSVNDTPRAYVWKPYASTVVLILGVQNIKQSCCVTLYHASWRLKKGPKFNWIQIHTSNTLNIVSVLFFFKKGKVIKTGSWPYKLVCLPPPPLGWLWANTRIFTKFCTHVLPPEANLSSAHSNLVAEKSSEFSCAPKSSTHVQCLGQCFSTAGPRPGTGPWHQLYRTARGSPGICHLIF